MRVEVRLFAVARRRAGRDSVSLDLPEEAIVADLKRALAAACPELAPLVPSLLFAVNASYATDATSIPADAELAVIPPVSGGSVGEPRPAPAGRPLEKGSLPRWWRLPTSRSTTRP